MILPALALTAMLHSYGEFGWEGYSWPASSYASTEVTIPRVGPPTGDISFWAGLGKGDPGIQQTGVDCAYRPHIRVPYGYCNAWYEMWPAPAYPEPEHVFPGDRMKFSVSRTGHDYVLQVFNFTRHWTHTKHETYYTHENTGEAITEALGPPLPGFAPAHFYNTSGILSQLYTFPFGGTYVSRNSSHSFTVHRL